MWNTYCNWFIDKKFGARNWIAVQKIVARLKDKSSNKTYKPILMRKTL